MIRNLIKKFVLILFGMFFVLSHGFAVVQSIGGDNNLLTTDEGLVLDTGGTDETLRGGTQNIGKNIQGGVAQTQTADIVDSASAKTVMIAKISKFVNYFLGMTSLVALVYLLIAGIRFIFGAAGSAKTEDLTKAVKAVSFSLLGIGASWLIVTFVFYIIGKF